MAPYKKIRKSTERRRNYHAHITKTIKILGSCQNELERARETIPKIVEKFNKLYYNKIKIQKFWITAFVNHPDLKDIIDDSEIDCLYYLDRLYVEESRLGHKIEFHFDKNPYFENSVIKKEFRSAKYIYDSTSQSTVIKWKHGMNLLQTNKSVKMGRKRGFEQRSFFGWFNDHTEPWSDNVAKIIKDDLWKKPLMFYLQMETSMQKT